MVHIQGSMGTQWVKCKSDWVIGRQNVPRTGQGFTEIGCLTFIFELRVEY